jgi:zinc protease
MIRLLAMLSLLLVLAACTKEASTVSDAVSPSGIRFSHVQMAGDNVAINVAWPTDWAFRDSVNKAVPGIGTELTLAGGAKNYPAGQAGELFADMKVEASLVASADYVFGSLVFNKDKAKDVLLIANAHLSAPNFDQSWMERIAGGWDKNITENAARPQTKLFEATRWAILGASPLRESLALDTPGIFTNVKQEDIRKWHGEVFNRSKAVVATAGAMTAQEAGEMVDELFNGLPTSTAQLKTEAKANFAPRRILLHLPETTTSQLMFIQSIPPTREGKEAEDFVIMSTLGGGTKSVLFKAVREGLRASYDFGAGLDGFSRNMRLFYMTGEVETSKLSQTETVVAQTFETFAKEASENLSDVKAQLIDAAEKSKFDPKSMSFTAVLAQLDGQPSTDTLKLKAVLEAVTRDTVKARLAANYPKPAGFIIVAISPDRSALSGACVISAPEEAANCK